MRLMSGPIDSMTRAFGELEDVMNSAKLVSVRAVRRAEGLASLVGVAAPVDLLVGGGVPEDKVELGAGEEEQPGDVEDAKEGHGEQVGGLV